MTLRTRLVVALLLLSTVGLAVFGVTTYELYSRSQYDRLDDQIRAATPGVIEQLQREAGLAGPRRVGIAAPLGAYGELRDPDGATLIRTPSTERPDLPDELGDLPARGRYLTVGTVDGSGEWRAFLRPAGADTALVIAVPLSEVNDALQRLVAIEGLSAAVLLAILGVGSWFILRRGLQPLEAMATSARTITAGDLSQRVSPSDEETEVGQLGLALNTMLGEIEVAFREREATEHRLRQFLADASHELRTPLTSIQGFAELFRLDPERVDLPTILRRIEQESARMKDLVEDLLLLARLDQVRPIERAEVDLAVLAADACTDAVAMAPGRPVSLVAPDPVVVLGDRGHLGQAITNLLINAVKHTPDGTPIEVAVLLDGGAAVVRVSDEGPGLDDEAMARAFDRFWQADAARVGHGAGLGLAIVAGIAAAHGGTASAANADGGGAVFTLHLPITP